MNIIVVDDDPIVLSLCTDILEGEGYRVTPVNNAPEAINLLTKKNYDLLITDIKMPKVSGLEIIKTLHASHSKTKSIIMTGFGNLETAQVAIKEGAYDYILKPFDNKAFTMAVKRAIDRKQLEEENTKLKELTSLFEVSNLIKTQFTPENLLQLILQSVITHVKATQGSIMLFDPKEKALKIAASIGLNEDIVKTTRIKAGEGIAGKVFREGQPLLVTNIDDHPLLKKHSHGHPDKSFISVSMGLNEEELISLPLVSAKSVLGVINVRNKLDNSPFSSEDLELISILATQAAVAVDNTRLFTDLNNVYLGVMQFMISLTEARDVYLRGHTQRVSHWCLRLGQAMRLSKEELSILKYAATLHDIGKLAISESILNKPGKLSADEYETIKKHPVVGAQVLKPFDFLDKARQIIYHHHERLDGKGYPDGISKDQLTIPMNIIILADSYDAMNSNRAYRDALSKQEITDEINRNKGTQFHPKVVDIFLQLLKK